MTDDDIIHVIVLESLQYLELFGERIFHIYPSYGLPKYTSFSNSRNNWETKDPSRFWRLKFSRKVHPWKNYSLQKFFMTFISLVRILVRRCCWRYLGSSKTPKTIHLWSNRVYDCAPLKSPNGPVLPNCQKYFSKKKLLQSMTASFDPGDFIRCTSWKTYCLEKCLNFTRSESILVLGCCWRHLVLGHYFTQTTNLRSNCIYVCTWSNSPNDHIYLNSQKQIDSLIYRSINSSIARQSVSTFNPILTKCASME